MMNTMEKVANVIRKVITILLVIIMACGWVSVTTIMILHTIDRNEITGALVFGTLMFCILAAMIWAIMGLVKVEMDED